MRGGWSEVPDGAEPTAQTRKARPASATATLRYSHARSALRVENGGVVVITPATKTGTMSSGR